MLMDKKLKEMLAAGVSQLFTIEVSQALKKI